MTMASARWWWLSFADPEKPPGSQWLGGCFVQGVDVLDCARTARRLGINPGGEVWGQRLVEGDEPPEEDRHRLFTHADMDKLERWNPGTRGES